MVVASLASSLGAQAATTVSRSSAQGLNLNLLGVATVVAPSPATTSTSDGTGAAVVHSNARAFSSLSLPPLLSSGATAGAVATYTEADPNGTSYACAGVVASGGTIQLGSSHATCVAVGGSGASGVTLDLSAIPAVSSLLNSLITVQLNLGTLTTFATETASGAASGVGHVSQASVTVRLLPAVTNLLNTLPLGTIPTTVTVPINITGAVNEPLLPAVLHAVTDVLNSDLSTVGAVPIVGPVVEGLLHGVLDPLLNNVLSLTGTSSLTSVLGLTTNHQTTSGGVLNVSALRIALLGGTVATGDIAAVTVGPNTSAPGSNPPGSNPPGSNPPGSNPPGSNPTVPKAPESPITRTTVHVTG